MPVLENCDIINCGRGENMDWFTIEKIDSKTFAISEYKHWEKMHSYLLIGENKALLIDSGLGIGDIKEEVEKLTQLPIILITTHVHWDHIGGHKHYDNIYAHSGDAKWLEDGLPIPVDFIKKDVIKDVKEFPLGFSIDDYEVYTGKPNHIVADKDIIDLGGRQIQVIHTPGHSPGHICLYDINNKYIFTGDLIYKGTLYAFYPSTDPVEFKKSVAKLLEYNDAERIFPAHNSLEIEPGIINKIHIAFESIEKSQGLKQGLGVFEFDEFKIHI